MQTYTYLGQHGIMRSIGFDINTTSATIRSALNTFTPYIEFVEPANEYDETASSNPNWASQIANEQELLYATVRSNPAYGNVAVLGPSFANSADASSVGALDSYEDAGNEHDYPCNSNPGTTGSGGIAQTTSLLRASTVTKPIWTTEVGYADNTAQWPCALSDAVIAKFVPRTVAERWLAGQTRTYFYQFADMSPGENYNSMGFVTQSGSPKPQYTALQSMIALLGDRGTSFQATPLSYALGGNTSNVHQLLLEKRDGSYYLMLWLEVPGWSGTSAVTVAPQTVSVSLAKAASSMTQYSYSSNWTLLGTSLSPSPSTQLTVTDAITFVHIQP